jgi:cob(I)alamin adenosyltransferase
MKIYTRAGDDGRTGLLGAGRVSKASARVEAYGTVDELNAQLGVVRSMDSRGWFKEFLGLVQVQLFTLGAELATVDPRLLAQMPRVSEADVTRFEQWMDAFDAELSPLRAFVLPAGAALAAQLHVARTVCRRAERRVIALSAAEPIEGPLVKYLNRLSDLLFVLARVACRRAGAAEVEWHPPKKEP